MKIFFCLPNLNSNQNIKQDTQTICSFEFKSQKKLNTSKRKKKENQIYKLDMQTLLTFFPYVTFLEEIECLWKLGTKLSLIPWNVLKYFTTIFILQKIIDWSHFFVSWLWNFLFFCLFLSWKFERNIKGKFYFFFFLKSIILCQRKSNSHCYFHIIFYYYYILSYANIVNHMDTK